MRAIKLKGLSWISNKRISNTDYWVDDTVDTGKNASNVICTKGENSCCFVSVFSPGFDTSCTIFHRRRPQSIERLFDKYANPDAKNKMKKKHTYTQNSSTNIQHEYKSNEKTILQYYINGQSIAG